jgi:2-phosphoglycerate kinase
MKSKKLILIGGASHTGKSTLARSLADRFNWNYYSTDKLARHPGRPWQPKFADIPQHVVDHYQLLSADELIADVIHHYRQNVWRLIEDIVISHVDNLSSKTMVIEGSALLPELVNTLKSDNISRIYLTASNEFISQRVYTESQYEIKSPFEQTLIDKFCQRNYLLNNQIIEAVDQLGLFSFNVEQATLPELIDKCLAVANSQPSQL